MGGPGVADAAGSLALLREAFRWAIGGFGSLRVGVGLWPFWFVGFEALASPRDADLRTDFGRWELVRGAPKPLIEDLNDAPPGTIDFLLAQ